ncbi:MAG: energy transducer TonB [Janthinobacterium lividum]
MPATTAAPVPAALRWTGALVVVLALHGAAAWLLLTQTIALIGPPAAPEAVMLDLAPDLPPSQPATIVPPVPAAPPPPTPAAAPPPTPAPEPPAPEPPAPQPLQPQLPPLDLPPTPPVAAEVELPVPPPPPPPRPQPKPKPKPPVRRVERQAAPPTDDTIERPIQPVAPAPAPVQAAPQASSRPPAPATSIPASWRGDLLGRLQRAKRYPDLARSRGDQGVATVSFTMDRAGRVLAVTLIRSSGSSLLDEEATALVRRAEPLPRLPEEITGATLTLTVPISFALR